VWVYLSQSLLSQGDSGGPLMVKMDNMHWTQIGIATGGYEFGFPTNAKGADIFNSKLFFKFY
jgi:hypothetical protein